MLSVRFGNGAATCAGHRTQSIHTRLATELLRQVRVLTNP